MLLTALIVDVKSIVGVLEKDKRSDIAEDNTNAKEVEENVYSEDKV